MATCSKIATTGTKTNPNPKSDIISPKLTHSVVTLVIDSVQSLVVFKGMIWSTDRSNPKGGSLKVGIPDFISPKLKPPYQKSHNRNFG